MNKKKKLIIAAISAVLIVAIGVFLVKPKEELEPITSFITSDTEIMTYDNLFYQNENGYAELNKKSLEKIGELYKEFSTEEMVEKIEKFNETYIDIIENINDLILLSESIQYETIKEVTDIKAVLVVDFKSSFADIYLKKYFKSENDIFFLKDDEAEKEIINSIVEANKKQLSTAEVAKLEAFLANMEIVAKKIGGRYVFALNSEYLNEYASKVAAENAETFLAKKFVELNDNQKMDLTLIDSKKIIERYKEFIDFKGYVDSIDYISIFTKFKNGKIEASFNINGAGKVFSLLDSSELQERKLKEYINDTFAFYIANNSFENLAREINSEVVRLYGLDYAQFAGMMLGGEPYTMINNLGDEAVINMNNPKAGIVLNTKDSQMLSDFLTKIGIPYDNGIYAMNQMTLELKDDKAFFNQEALTYENEIDFNNLAIYTKLDLEFIVNNYYQLNELGNMGIEFFTPELSLYTTKDMLSLKLKTDYEEFMNYAVSMSKAVQKQDDITQ